MRILHVLSNLEVGGTELNTVRLAAALQQRGHDQIVVSLGAQTDPKLIERCSVPCTAPTHDLRLAGSIFRLLRLIREFRPQLIHGRNYRTWTACVAAATLAGRDLKTIQSFHGPTSLDLAPRWRKLVAARLASRTSAIIAVSRDLMQRIEGQWRIRCCPLFVVANGIDTNQFSPDPHVAATRDALRIAPEELIVGCVGSLREVKNHELLLQAFASFLATGRRGILLLVGDGPLRGRLERLAEELGISQHVRFAGSQSSVIPFLRIMQIYVQPSLKEGSPTAVLEAMSCGLPAICLRSSGCNELHQQWGLPLVVDAKDAAALTAQLQVLADDAGLRQVLSLRARSVVRQAYCFARMVADYEQIYIDTAAATQRCCAVSLP